MTDADLTAKAAAKAAAKPAAKAAESGWVATADGTRRKVLAETPELMIVEFAFETGAVGAPHRHPHVQGTYVRSGRFAFTVDGAERMLAPGDTLVIPSNAVHGCTAIEAGSLIDTFTPRRDDFL